MSDDQGGQPYHPPTPTYPARAAEPSHTAAIPINDTAHLPPYAPPSRTSMPTQAPSGGPAGTGGANQAFGPPVPSAEPMAGGAFPAASFGAPPASVVPGHPGAQPPSQPPAQPPVGTAGFGDVTRPAPTPPSGKGGRAARTLGVAALALICGFGGGFAGQKLAANDADTQPAGVAQDGQVAKIAAKVLPSVVTLKVTGSTGGGTGSGFVIDNDGHVLTNNHVVALGADGGKIEAILSNGDRVPATIVGRDVSYDLAVVKLDRTNVPPIPFGKSSLMAVGDPVMAVGAPLGLQSTVTTGIISALNRPVTPGSGDETSYINALQTDAAINPGNSGGPLLNLSGEVIGVNSAIARIPGSSSGTGGSIGLGFAIPGDQAKRIADELIKNGRATHPLIGVQVDRNSDGSGARVSSDADAITKGSPADKAGLRPGDLITQFDGRRIDTADELIVGIRSHAVGDTVTLRVERNGKVFDVKMTLQGDNS